jgi:hypothetical protein
MKDVLLELATSYELMNPIQRIVPGQLFRKIILMEMIDDVIDGKIE